MFNNKTFLYRLSLPYVKSEFCNYNVTEISRTDLYQLQASLVNNLLESYCCDK